MKIFKRVLLTLAIISLLLFLILMFIQIINPKFKTTFTLLSFALYTTLFGFFGILETKNSFDNEDRLGELVFSLSIVIVIIGAFAIGGYVLTVLNVKL